MGKEVGRELCMCVPARAPAITMGSVGACVKWLQEREVGVIVQEPWG